MLRRIHILLVFFIINAAAASAQQPIAPGSLTDEPLELSADEVDYDGDEGVYIARGSVFAKQGEITIAADRVWYHPQNGRIAAEGNVEFFRGADKLGAEKFEFDFRAQTGLIIKGNLYFLESGYFFEGDRIEKTGPESYRIVNGRFTTCACPRCPDGEPGAPTWRLSGSDISITIGGYAFAADGIFYLKDIPVLYLPYMIVPAKTERETGLLVPEIAYSNLDGLSLDPKLYIVLDDHSDMTLTGRLKTNRGYGLGTEVRYRLPGGGYGEFHGDYFREDFLYQGDERIELNWRHLQFLDDRFSFRAKVSYLGDDSYYHDYSRDLNQLTQEWTESQLSLSVREDSALSVLAVEFIEDLGSPWVMQYQRAPALYTDIYRVPILGSPLYFEADIDLENFLYYDKTLDSFENSLSVVGQRAEIFPRFSIPYSPGGLMFFDISGGWRQYFYHLAEKKESIMRGRPEAEATVGTSIFRNFGRGAGDIANLKHVITPRIEYRYSPDFYLGRRTTENYFFVSDRSFDWLSESDAPYIDEQDRRPGLNVISYSLSTSLIAAIADIETLETGEKFAKVDRRELLEIEGVGAYHFGPDGGPADWLLRLRSKPVEYLALKAEASLREYGVDRVRSWMVGADINWPEVAALNVEYHQGEQDIIREQYRAEPTYEISSLYFRPSYQSIKSWLGFTAIPQIEASWYFEYVIPERLVAASGYSVKYTSVCQCWSVKVEYLDLFEEPGRRSADEIRAWFNLIGLGSSD